MSPFDLGPELLIVLLKSFLDLLRDHQVFWLCFAVYQIRPVQIATGRPLSSSEGAENDKTRIFGRVFTDFGREQRVQFFARSDRQLASL